MNELLWVLSNAKKESLTLIISKLDKDNKYKYIGQVDNLYEVHKNIFKDVLNIINKKANSEIECINYTYELDSIIVKIDNNIFKIETE